MSLIPVKDAQVEKRVAETAALFVKRYREMIEAGMKMEEVEEIIRKSARLRFCYKANRGVLSAEQRIVEMLHTQRAYGRYCAILGKVADTL